MSEYTIVDDIPSITEPPTQSTPSSVVAQIMSALPSRRALLKGLFVAATTAMLVPLEWIYTQRKASADASGPETEYTYCVKSYEKLENNWPADGLRICTGGDYIGSFPCDHDGYHREFVSYHDQDRIYTSNRINSCYGRNAWRWLHKESNRNYRCSDAWTTIWKADQGPDEDPYYEGPTIAACKL